ncbi:hypothetical protein NMG60_11026888 [Bertholletia excelsa]
MGIARAPKHQLLYAFQLLLLIQQSRVFCYRYQVGDLNCWGIPSSSNPQVYANWAKIHTFVLGDSLLFLYPPSQDSVIQVTKQSYDSCNLKDPILYMNNGNSLFNVTKPGEFYFTSGREGSCDKFQKLHISVSGNGSSFAYPPDSLPASAPSYPTVFGSIPMAPMSSPMSSSSASLDFPVIFLSVAIGLFICALTSLRT